MIPGKLNLDGPHPLLLSVKQASAWLGIPVFTLYSWAQTRRIPHYKLGRRVLFSRDDLRKWLEDQQVPKVD